MQFKIKFTKSQWERFSEIVGNIGLVSFASIFVPYLLDKPNSLIMISGLLISAGMWYISLVFARKY